MLNVANFMSNIGKTIFYLGYTTDSDGPCDFAIFQNAAEVKGYLHTLPVTSFGEPTIITGVLTRASSIPTKLDDDTDIFLVTPFATEEFNAYIRKCVDLKDLARFIEALICSNLPDLPEDICEELSCYAIQDIDDIFIIYGQEVVLSYTFDEESIDDALTSAALAAYKTIEEMQ